MASSLLFISSRAGGGLERLLWKNLVEHELRGGARETPVKEFSRTWVSNIFSIQLINLATVLQCINVCSWFLLRIIWYIIIYAFSQLLTFDGTPSTTARHRTTDKAKILRNNKCNDCNAAFTAYFSKLGLLLLDVVYCRNTAFNAVRRSVKLLQYSESKCPSSLRKDGFQFLGPEGDISVHFRLEISLHQQV